MHLLKKVAVNDVTFQKKVKLQNVKIGQNVVYSTTILSIMQQKSI